jgi:hypothetical protein
VTPPTTDTVVVRWLNLPVRLMGESVEHQRDLMREFALIQISDGNARVNVPSRLVSLVERHRREFSALGLSRRGEVSAVLMSGVANVDLEMDLPRTAEDAAIELLETFVLADEFSERGELLTLATPPEIVAFRGWFLGEIVCQFEGEPPSPWRDAGGR